MLEQQYELEARQIWRTLARKRQAELIHLVFEWAETESDITKVEVLVGSAPLGAQYAATAKAAGFGARSSSSAARATCRRKH